MHIMMIEYTKWFFRSNVYTLVNEMPCTAFSKLLPCVLYSYSSFLYPID